MDYPSPWSFGGSSPKHSNKQSNWICIQISQSEVDSPKHVTNKQKCNLSNLFNIQADNFYTGGIWGSGWSSGTVQILKIFPFAMQLTPLWQLSTGLVGRGDCPCWAYPFNNFQQVWSRGDTALAGQFSLVVHRDNWQIFFRKCLSVLSAGAVRGDNKARTSMARISLGVWL